ncbi:MAG: rod shape-determining protein MreC [Rubrobacteraceae bacterium]
MRRRNSRLSKGLISVIILCFVSLVLFTVYVREGDAGPLHTVQLGSAEILRPVRSMTAAVAQPFKNMGQTVSGAFEKETSKRKLQQEQVRNQELGAQAARLQRENAKMRQMLDGKRVSFKYAPLARVVAPVGGQFTKRVVINVGTKDGVKPEQPVIVGDNTLVGRTTDRVTAHTAEVLLVTDQNFAAGVNILPPADFDPSSGKTTGNTAAVSSPGGGTTGGATMGGTTSGTTTSGTTTSSGATSGGVAAASGLLQTTADGYLGVDYVDVSAKVERGYFVVTSGRAGSWQLLFPPGLFVGKVESVSSQDISQYKTIVVKSAVNPDNLDYVRVITGW